MSHSAASDAVTCFPLADLEFAVDWSEAAPGWGGWGLVVEDAEWGELVSVTPPGAVAPVFFITPAAREPGVEVIRIHASGDCHWEEGIAHAPDLRAALLLLCPLPHGSAAPARHDGRVVGR